MICYESFREIQKLRPYETGKKFPDSYKPGKTDFRQYISEFIMPGDE